MAIRAKVGIIGAGPAGMAAALQLKHQGVEFVLFERDSHGSLLKNARNVENCLGFSPKLPNMCLSGIELLSQYKKHLYKKHIPITHAEVMKLTWVTKKTVFVLKTENNIYHVDYVIVASGTKPKILPQLEKLSPQLRKRVLFEVYLLRNKQDKRVVIIGAGDAAFDYAINLAEHAHKVFVINKSNKIKGLPKLYAKMLKYKNVTYFTATELIKIVSNGKNAVKCIFAHNEEDICLDVDYLLIAIGRTLQKDFYSRLLHKEEHTLMLAKKLFLCGDVNSRTSRQVAIAIGEGIEAAMQIGIFERR